MDVGAADSSLIDVARFVSEYGAHVDAHSAALFVGSGASSAAGFPSWEALVAPYREALRIESQDLPLVVQYFEDATPDGANRIRTDIIRLVGDSKASPVETHRRLLGLPIPDIWTTNYDPLLETAAAQLGIEVTVYAEDPDLATVRPTLKRLYKMHGTVDENRTSTELVISRDDFDRYPTTHPRFWQLLRAHFLTRSFLFVGFSLSDPNIAELFRLARLTTSDVNHPHYAVLPRVTGTEAERRLAELRRNDLARVGVRVVEIENHSLLDTVLARLTARCRPPRAYLSGSLREGGDSDRALAVADELGTQLATHRDVLLMAGGDLGAKVGYVMSKARHGLGIYRPEDFLVIRRVKDEPVTSPNQRWGEIVFTGEEAELLRSKAFGQVRAVVVLGGANRTRQELALAREIGMGVIALAATGGAAAEQWAADIQDPDYRLGERPVDKQLLDLLNHEDPRTVALATIQLMRQALFLD